MEAPPLRTRLILAALLLTVAAGVADRAFASPNDALAAVLRTILAGGSATVALLQFVLFVMPYTLHRLAAGSYDLLLDGAAIGSVTRDVTKSGLVRGWDVELLSADPPLPAALC